MLIVVALSQQMYLLPVHIGAFFVTIAAVVIADLHAALWVLGKIEVLPKKRMRALHLFVGYGLLVSILSGFIMFLPLQDYLLSHLPFWIKLGFVGALVINSFVISTHMNVAASRSFKSLERKERTILLISGIVSTISWIGAFTAAQFLGL